MTEAPTSFVTENCEPLTTSVSQIMEHVGNLMGEKCESPTIAASEIIQHVGNLIGEKRQTRKTPASQITSEVLSETETDLVSETSSSPLSDVSNSPTSQQRNVPQCLTKIACLSTEPVDESADDSKLEKPRCQTLGIENDETFETPISQMFETPIDQIVGTPNSETFQTMAGRTSQTQTCQTLQTPTGEILQTPKRNCFRSPRNVSVSQTIKNGSVRHVSLKNEKPLKDKNKEIEKEVKCTTETRKTSMKHSVHKQRKSSATSWNVENKTCFSDVICLTHRARDAANDLVKFVETWNQWIPTVSDFPKKNKQINKYIVKTHDACLEWMDFEEKECNRELITSVFGNTIAILNTIELKMENVGAIARQISSAFKKTSLETKSEDEYVLQLWRIVGMLSMIRTVCIFYSDESCFLQHDSRLYSDTTKIPAVIFARSMVDVWQNTFVNDWKDDNFFPVDHYIYKIGEMGLEIATCFFNKKTYDKVIGDCQLDAEVDTQTFPNVVRQLDVIMDKLMLNDTSSNSIAFFSFSI
ncbi:MAG: hypothetical protein K0U78_02735 [Actinomycetia bacterium]|nr:hypothetical protein [Actinomycetes bacterium]